MAKNKRKVKSKTRSKKSPKKGHKDNPMARLVKSELFLPKKHRNKAKYKRKPKHKGKDDE